MILYSLKIKFYLIERISMGKLKQVYHFFHTQFLSEEIKHKGEKVIVGLAITSFLFHLLVIFLVDFGIIAIKGTNELLTNPIAAVYTPFSFILIYEVYLLVYYLPKSITVYIGKQYEIITLIVIRRVFKDLSNLELTPDWFKTPNDLQFTYDILATIVLFLLIFFFYSLNDRRSQRKEKSKPVSESLNAFIRTKNAIAVVLVPVFLVLGVYSLSSWIYENFFSISQMVGSIKDVNKVFFDEFFTILILTDVLLLLVSFTHTNQFSKVIRNSGFIISTILIKLSFGTEGLLNTLLIISAVLFGLIILAIHNLFAKRAEKENLKSISG